MFVCQPYTLMLAVAYESSGQPLPQVSEEGHSRSSPVLCNAPRLLMAYCVVFILPTTAKNCNDYLRCQFNSETCHRRYVHATLRFYLSTLRMQRKTGYMPLHWLYCEAWMATKLARF